MPSLTPANFSTFCKKENAVSLASQSTGLQFRPHTLPPSPLQITTTATTTTSTPNQKHSHRGSARPLELVRCAQYAARRRPRHIYSTYVSHHTTVCNNSLLNSKSHPTSFAAVQQVGEDPATFSHLPLITPDPSQFKKRGLRLTIIVKEQVFHTSDRSRSR